MVATAIFLHLRPHRHRQSFIQTATSCTRFYSSSSSNSDDNRHNRISPSQSQSHFSDVKSSLKQSAPSVQHTRRPLFDNSISVNREDPARKAPSFEEIRKNLSKFNRPSSGQPPPSAAPAISFQELYRRNVTPKTDPVSVSETGKKRDLDYLKEIGISLKSMPPNPSQSGA